MSSPLITIGITAYNAVHTIQQAVDSAFAQTHRPLEVVVVDDASTDGTASILKALAGRHAEIQLLINDTNSGVATSRNRVVAEAKGEFVAFFDDDDVSRPSRLAKQLERVLEYEASFAHGALVICHSAREQIYQDGSRRIERTMGEREGRMAPHGPAVARRILAGAPLEDAYGSCATCSQMARTTTYRALGGFDPMFRRAEDSDLAVRLALAGGHFTGIGEPLVIQTMTKTAEKSLDDEHRWRLALIDKHATIFADPAELQFCRDWIALKHCWLSGRHLAFAAELTRLALRHPRGVGQRLWLAVPNIGSNQALAHFHRRDAG